MLVTLQEMKTYLGIPGKTYPTVSVVLSINTATGRITRSSGTWGSEVIEGALLNLLGFSNAENNVQIAVTEVVSTTVIAYLGPIDMITEVGVGTSYSREAEASDTTYDVFLTEQLQIISDTVEAYCRRVFASNTYTQTFYPEELQEFKKSRELLLFHYPLTAVGSVLVDGEAFTDYRIHQSGILVLNTTTIAYGKYWADIFEEDLVVEYTAGLNATPTPVKSAIYTLVAERYQKKVAGVDVGFGSDVQRISIPGVMSIDFDYTLQSNERKSAFGMILGNWINVLDNYRSERAIMGTVKLSYVV